MTEGTGGLVTQGCGLKFAGCPLVYVFGLFQLPPTIQIYAEMN